MWKTPSLLFGLATACATTQPTSSYPLCDGSGAPACGNIGQVGRATVPPSRATDVAPASVRATAQAPARPTPIVNVLLGASSSGAASLTFARPLLDHRERVVCANLVGKGGTRRVCTAPDGTQVSSTRLGDDGEPATADDGAR